ncbi:endodeoxyribonuclease RusA [Streptococcus bovimastitidis]|uniref:Endodeoxyribonuclease RusA n=1 Tax=Streptococcus bovimastitidis TaxID=1856638 RepID=A0A1L8ML15_9STRE|nr:endodeoxyribonuclease RusA [Streptococcus bovimastitidis]OJF71464.1 endodeoxyribonuclease RusA [Streptococcus bovimastitidis]
MKYEFILENTKQRKEMLSSNDRLHFRKSAPITKYLRRLAKLTANKAINKNEPFSKNKPCSVSVTVFSPTNRRFDPPNTYPTLKAILDGFTDAGIWEDDNFEVIKSLSFEYGGLSGVKDKYKFEIEIEELL